VRWWWVGFGLVGCVVLGVLAWFWGAAAADRGRSEAVDRLIRSRRYAEAVQQADEWIAAAPNSALAHYQRARALIGRDEPQEALEAADRARKLGFDIDRLSRILGIVYARSGKSAMAEPILRESEVRDRDPDCLVEETLARLYLADLRLGAALQAIERWSQAAPNDPRPDVLRAEIDRQMRVEPGTIASYYRSALERDPQFGPARLGLATTLREQGQYAAALEEYRRYLDQDPGSETALAGAGRCALDAGLEDEARGWFDQALRNDPDQVDALEGCAALALKKKDWETALGLLDRLVKLDPAGIEHHYRRSQALEHLKRTDEARAERGTTERLRRERAELDNLRLALIKSPRDPERQAELAAWLLEHDQIEEGLTLAQRLVQRPGGHPPTALRLSQYYEKQGNPGLANFYRTQARGGARTP
jgi:tetratricopeptide (TPR) repeat protein